MKKRLLSVVIISFLFITSCSSSKVLLNPEYNTQPASARLVAIIIQDSQPGIFYNSNVKLLFGDGDKDSLIWNFYKTKIIEQISFSLKPDKVFFDSIVNQYLSSKELISIGGTSYEISIPSSGTKLNLNSGNEAELIILIDQIGIGTELSFSSNPGFMTPNGFMGGGMSASKELVFRSDFLIWDNLNKKPVSYGHLESKASGMFPIITKMTWENVSSKYINQMLKKATFK